MRRQTLGSLAADIQLLRPPFSLPQAIRSDNPVIFFEHVLLYNVKGQTHEVRTHSHTLTACCCCLLNMRDP